MGCGVVHHGTAKVAIVGTGFVGSTTAYAMMMNGVASRIALIDAKKEKAEGEALDLLHGLQFTHSVDIVAGDSFELVKEADVVVITAGFAQKSSGETRQDLLDKNVAVFQQIIPEIVRYNQDCILLVVTNPLDVLTYVTTKLSGFPRCRVFGTGTVLDTARLRYLIGRHFNVSPKDVTAYILGEHGDAEFLWASGAQIAGTPLNLFDGYSESLLTDISLQTKNAVYDIIQKKGATYYAIALGVVKIVRAILLDQSRVFSVSTLVEDEFYGVRDICLSLPTIVRKSGVCERLPVVLSQHEQMLLRASSESITRGINRANKLIGI
ncbi:MAG: L-lactate dehydrogenase [Candidatus Babeliales bacterium]